MHHLRGGSDIDKVPGRSFLGFSIRFVLLIDCKHLQTGHFDKL